MSDAKEPLTRGQVLSLCNAHNFWTWSAQAEVDPLPIEHAEGVYFWDFDGKRYLDFNSMVMCSNIGHGERRVIDAIAEQAAELAFAAPSMATRVRARACRALAEIMPGELDHFLFTLGGAEAVENAIKLARAYTGRHKILARYRSYHGATHGAIAATGDSRRWAWEPTVMPGVVHFLGPYALRDVQASQGETPAPQPSAQAALAHLEAVMRFEGPDTIAAVLLETVPGANGVLVPPPDFLPGVRRLCDRYGVLLICDEVMSGFGRTGAWFAVEHWGVTPDLMTMAKGLTSGYAPLGAVAMHPAIAAHFNHRAYQGGLTYNGHPISLAAAVANIAVLQEDDLIARAARMGPLLEQRLHMLKKKHPSVREVRSIGLFGAIELAPRGDDGERGSAQRLDDGLRRFFRRRGLRIILRGDNLLVIPPLIISKEELMEGLAIIEDGLRGLERTASGQGSWGD